MRGLERGLWKEDIHTDTQILEKKNFCELVDQPKHTRILRIMSALKRKRETVVSVNKNRNS